MAKTSSVNRNAKRERMTARDKGKRAELKARVMDRSAPVEERFEASMKLAELPRNGSAVRVRLRCALTGRSPRQLPQVQALPEHAPLAGQPGATPWRGQGELVGDPACP